MKHTLSLITLAALLLGITACDTKPHETIKTVEVNTSSLTFETHRCFTVEVIKQNLDKELFDNETLNYKSETVTVTHRSVSHLPDGSERVVSQADETVTSFEKAEDGTFLSPGEVSGTTSVSTRVAKKTILPNGDVKLAGDFAITRALKQGSYGDASNHRTTVSTFEEIERTTDGVSKTISSKTNGVENQPWDSETTETVKDNVKTTYSVLKSPFIIKDGKSEYIVETSETACTITTEK